jgi:squalene-hopene/tetraprenyl-beta-curcumene cyclase
MSPTLLLLTSLAAADPTPVPKPAATREDEPIAAAFSPAKAAEYLDGVGVNWTRDKKCITCHTNLPYMLARPLLPGDAGWKEVREFLETDVGSWSSGGKPRGEAYVVVTAFALAFHDRQGGGGLRPATRAALDRMWKGQKPTGEWNWLKCNWPPMEHDDYYGATIAALAVGVAPGDYAQTDAAKAGVERLRAYFKKTPAPDLHHRAMLLWASTKLGGLLSAEERKKVVAELKGKQRADGSWALPALGTYKRHDGTDNDPAGPGDGYATGLAVYVLRQAGVSADDPAVVAGVTWLKGNQRESGRWYTRSLNNDKAHHVTNAGTAFAVLALDACEGK